MARQGKHTAAPKGPLQFGEAGRARHGKARRGGARQGNTRCLRAPKISKIMSEQTMDEVLRLPLWKGVLDEMREEGLSYDLSWPAEFFEKRLRCDKGTDQFQLQMLAIKQDIEARDGFYLRSSKSGAVWEIPSAPEHEDIAVGLDAKVRRCAVRSINLRAATLMNPDAVLTESERQRMESGLERASIRLVLISRQKSVVDILQANAPKLLERVAK
jgi:hypothetical protein